MEKYKGVDRREKTPLSPSDFLKLWPVIIILASSLGGYYVLMYRVSTLESNLKELKVETKENFKQLHELLNRQRYGIHLPPKGKTSTGLPLGKKI